MSEKRLIPCMLDKCRAGEFLSLKDAGLCNIDTQCASTLTARYCKGIGSNHDNMVIEVITYEIPQKVRVRKHPVDCVDLCKCLRQHKETQKLTNRQIAEELNIPLTKVEHWFRQDGSFAIPDEDVWGKLKKLLNIATERFDKSIMTFEEKDGVYEKGNRIYDEIGLSPTITCSEPIEVLVAEENMDIKQIGSRWGDETDFKNKTSGRVYDKNFISPALNTMQGGWKQPMIVAMRGRDIENHTKKTEGMQTEQKLEPVCLNSKGGRGGIDGLQPSLQDRVYSTKAISPAVTTSFMPNFLEEERNEKNYSYNNKELEGICTKGKTIDIASTILAGYERTNMTGFNADNGVLEVIKEYNRTAKHQQDLIQHQNDVCRAIPAGTHGSTPHLTKTVVCHSPFRIRKLTPKECWRLMGFTDEDFHKAEAVNSNTQLYKQAGNSIVKDVLMAIFKQMM